MLLNADLVFSDCLVYKNGLFVLNYSMTAMQTKQPVQDFKSYGYIPAVALYDAVETSDITYWTGEVNNYKGPVCNLQQAVRG